MASGSTKADRPSWQKALLAVPETQRSLRQEQLIGSIICMEHAVSVFQRASHSPLYFKSPEILNALCALVRLNSMNGGHSSWEYRYFLSKKTLVNMKQYYTALCRELLFEKNVKITPEPEILVPKWLAAIVLSGFSIENKYILDTEADTAERRELNLPLKEACDGLIDFESSRWPSPSTMSKCDTYMEETLDSLPAANSLLTMLYDNSRALGCLCCLDSSPFVFDEFESLMKGGKHTIKILARPQQIYRLTNFTNLRYYFTQLSWCYRSVRLAQTNQSDTAGATNVMEEVEWWEAAESYVSMVHRALKEVKEAIPADPYNVAVVSRMLLQALLCGISKTISYSEIKALSNEIKSAVAVCAAWAPPLWKMEMDAYHKIVIEEVLPLLRKINPTSYKTVSIDVFDTPGYLDIYTRDGVTVRLLSKHGKTCAHCGRKGNDLLKCGGCQCVWYCDRECQKKGWKIHKIECKKAQC